VFISRSNRSLALDLVDLRSFNLLDLSNLTLSTLDLFNLTPSIARRVGSSIVSSRTLVFRLT
jgi:hypothetical protein